MAGQVVTVMNMKGGVGKTTVSLQVASVAACALFPNQGPKKVLLIDYDPQFNLSQALLPSKQYFELEKAKKTILSVLVEDDLALDPYHLQVPGNENPPKLNDVKVEIIKFKNGSRLDLVPSTLDLMYVALGHANSSTKPMEVRFEKFINECKKEYDLIVIDCHPAGSVFTKTSLRNSDHVLIPVALQRYAIRGIGLMMTFIESKKQGTKGPIPHILFNLAGRSGVEKAEVEIRANKNYESFCLKHTLKRYSAFNELDGGKGFLWENKKAYSTEAWKNASQVTSEFLKRIGVIQ
ncbi:ParA family protein [Janthinobacterium sp. SUN100]|uniref:ParA family protein n=1 Tax=Janthinobacterium sp. SUN100 TaxID=3004101 RepID=UPI0025B0D2DA|nr:ParA family protein [Janthinobacterium sp. SUN100]MDN2704483.1 ParA family protein [Janthinobacterium sp. SUN100]